ncbi:MAG TPA: RagB/SusD family nutrient uptake outer membrane protein [Gemmatimonadaceae bacterium]|nr:RagB/SusD family nutrient uptake outer membrane protein [Gemmatimonadaceae bacterium]
MKKYTTIALAVAGLAIAGCKDNAVVNPVDAPTVEALSGALTRGSLQQVATGVLAQDRAAVVGTFTFYVLSGIFARDLYRIDASEPRYVQETLGGNPDPGSFAGGGGWTQFYTAIRAANNLLLALPTASSIELSNAEKSATAGFIKTIKALDYYRLAELRDTVGIAIQTDDASAVTDIRCKTASLAYIASLLDSALTDLNAAGGATKLPFVLPTGYTAFGRDYSTVSNIILFNRGLKGKVNFYRGLDRTAPQPALFATAIAELTQALGGAAPGGVPASRFSWGPYYNFVPGGSENTANNRADARIGLNPMVRDSIQAGDTRASKIVTITPITGFGVSTNSAFSGSVTSNAANASAPIGILRDEELVLLRAQAYIEAGNLGAAAADLNSVRTTYGLAPIALTSLQQARSAVLYEKRYSLLFEGPQRLVDLRGYGRLNATFFRRELPTDPFNAAFPIPRAEQDARGGSVTGCVA